MQCDGCYYQDRKENICLHGSPIFDINDNCTDYVEDDFVKKIRADERARIIEELFDKCVDTVDMDSNYLYVKVNRENFNIPQIPLRSLLKKWVIEQLISRG